jgi:hypothetical protein
MSSYSNYEPVLSALPENAVLRLTLPSAIAAYQACAFKRNEGVMTAHGYDALIQAERELQRSFDALARRKRATANKPKSHFRRFWPQLLIKGIGMILLFWVFTAAMILLVGGN